MPSGCAADGEVGAALGRAAQVMDIGRSVDFFDRHEHAARIVLATEVFGFTHREIALTAAVIAAAGDEDEVGKALSPLVQKDDRRLGRGRGRDPRPRRRHRRALPARRPR